MTQAHPTDGPGNESLTIDARTFVLLAVPVGLTAGDIGFDLGAFETIDHRRFWAIWVLSTLALFASLVFRDVDRWLGGWWRFALAIPSLWLIGDLVAAGDGAVIFVLSVLSIATLPFAAYVLIQLLAADFFHLSTRAQVGLVLFALTTFVVGYYVGDGHHRFLTCDDFARIGDFVPDDCRE